MGYWKHYARLLALIAIAVIAFVQVRAAVVPKDFGKLGRFRASAIREAAAREPRHLGSKACEECHTQLYETWSKGKHAIPQCENCHGPGLMHVKTVSDDSTDAYPDVIKHNRLALRVTSGIQECKWCHLRTFERPSTLKSITSVGGHITKYGGTFSPDSKCIDCHDPHTTLTLVKQTQVKR